MPTAVSRAERQRTLPRRRYLFCPHCRVYVSAHWRHDYCQRCYRTFATGKYDQAR